MNYKGVRYSHLCAFELYKKTSIGLIFSLGCSAIHGTFIMHIRIRIARDKKEKQRTIASILAFFLYSTMMNSYFTTSSITYEKNTNNSTYFCANYTQNHPLFHTLSPPWL